MSNAALWSHLKLHTWAMQECKVKVSSARCLCWTYPPCSPIYYCSLSSDSRKTSGSLHRRGEERPMQEHLWAPRGLNSSGHPWAPSGPGLNIPLGASFLRRYDFADKILVYRVCLNRRWEDASTSGFSSCFPWQDLKWNHLMRLDLISQVWYKRLFSKGPEHLEMQDNIVYSCELS